jgi:hypothetical protein
LNHEAATFFDKSVTIWDRLDIRLEAHMPTLLVMSTAERVAILHRRTATRDADTAGQFSARRDAPAKSIEALIAPA